MAEKLVSPGVFTQENDLSFLPQGVSEIGAAIIGPTLEGPAFVPTLVESSNDFFAQFGAPSPEIYTPYCVMEYLKSAGRVTIVRILYDQEWEEVADSQSVAIGIGDDAVGAYSTGSIELSGVFAQDDQVTITYGSTTYTFKADVDPVSEDVGNLYYFESCSVIADTAASMSEKINSVNISWLNNTSVDTSTISFTASISHSNYNNVVFASDDITFTLTQMAGGVDPTYAAIAGLILPTSKYWNEVTGDSDNKITLTYVEPGKFNVTATGVTPDPVTYSCSLDSAASNYYIDTLGNDPRDQLRFVYLHSAFPDAITDELETTTDIIDDNNYGMYHSGGHGKARTPWVYSQDMGNTRYQLFRIKTVDDGTKSNKKVKIGIYNVKHASATINGNRPYTLFNLLVRKWDDTDQTPTVYETYTNLNLDPDSENYICRRIGDQYKEFIDGKLYIRGDYGNVSKYIFVEVNDSVGLKNVPRKVEPVAFAPLTYPIVIDEGISAGDETIPSASIRFHQTASTGEKTKKVWLGFNYEEDTALAYLAPIPEDGSGYEVRTGLNVYDRTDNVHVQFSSESVTGDDWTASVEEFNMMLPFQGGHDGCAPYYRISNPITNGDTYGVWNGLDIMGFEDLANFNSDATAQYRKALNTVKNQDELDINMIITPGIPMDAGGVTTYAKNICEDRGDCFYIVDTGGPTQTIASAIQSADAWDTSYAACYYPWVKIKDVINNKYVWVPPTTVMGGVMTFNDRVAYPWYAPAGLNRGGISSAIQTYTRLTHDERDDLYENNVNPLASFPGQGVVAWGQKTLQVKESALDRINVRRLLIKLKKFIASTSRYLVFENNTTQTRAKFLNIVNPYLDSVQQRQGLYAFKVVMDATNNPSAIIDRNIMKGEIYLQPAKTAEFIVIDFNVMPTGAEFPE